MLQCNTEFEAFSVNLYSYWIKESVRTALCLSPGYAALEVFRKVFGETFR